MAIETEVKIRLMDAERLRRQLRLLSCRLMHPRHFEDNFLLDFADGRLGSRSSMVRVRFTGSRAWVTYKGAPRPDGPFKTRDEFETEVEDGAAALRILESLDLQIWFRYQKYREEYAMATSQKPGDDVCVALDETPVGVFAELEGSEEGIRIAAAELGFSESEFLRESYHSLYLEDCERKGEAPGYMIFPGEPQATNLSD